MTILKYLKITVWFDIPREGYQHR